MENQANVGNQNDIDQSKKVGVSKLMKKIGFVLVMFIYSIGILYLGFRIGQTSLPISPGTKIEETQNSQTVPLKKETYFQKILKTHCRNSDNFSGIELDNLPVKVDTNKIEIIYERKEQGTIICWSPPNNTGYVSIRYHDNLSKDLENDQILFVYDGNSEELAHGGYPFLGQIGKTIKSSGSVKLNVYLNSSEIGPVIGQNSVNLRGEKTFELPGGETIFVNTTRDIIRADDPRLITLLKKYAQNPKEGISSEKEKIVDDRDGAEEEIFSKFFLNIQTPEKEVLESVEDLLGSVSLVR